MSKMSVDGAIQRIKGAPTDSPIMVLRIDGSDLVDAVFASTVVSKAMIDAFDDRIIGVFDQTMDMGAIRSALEAATVD
jgi:hypothetical protein